MLIDRTETEQGFTLVEMIIVMVLLAIVFASISLVVSTMWIGATDTTARGRAQAQSNDLVKTLGNDARQAMSPVRSDRNANKAVLRAAFVSTDPATKVQLADIVRATDDTLWLWSDAIADDLGATECVGYVDDPDQGLVRSVYAASAGCPGTGTPIDEMVIASTRIGDSAATPRFRYVLTYNPSLYGDIAAYDVTKCVTARDVSLPDQLPAGLPAANALASIVGIDVDGVTQEKSGRIQQGTRVSFALVSRNNRKYQYAMGCAY